MFERKIYRDVERWRERSGGKTALLIEGARRVGKSTIVEAFAKREYESYILIDMAFASEDVQDLFRDLSDLDYFFLQLQLQYGVKLHERKSLIIFDEVQFNPVARQAIKKLVADGRYDYIETGSLISIRKNVQDILIPSEEVKIEMFPMDFEEFLWATGERDLSLLLREAYQARRALGQAVHRQLMRHFRLYMLVGGMPQAVQEYIDKNNLEEVDQVKRQIIALYQNDFYKIDPSGRISALFSAIPAELARHSRRYSVAQVLNGSGKTLAEAAVAELIASKTVLPAYNVTDPQLGLASFVNRSEYKLYLADTGLMTSLAFADSAFTENDIYKKLLADKLPVNLGYIYENIVAQTIASRGDRLYYNSYYDQDKKRSVGVDFLVPKGDKLQAVEVKSSSYKAHKSLDRFAAKFKRKVAEKIVIYTKDYAEQDGTRYLPAYFAHLI